MAKQDDYTRYTVRIPGPLYERVGRAAEVNNRSVNAEIVATLEEKYPAPAPLGDLRPLTDWAVWIDLADDEAEKNKREAFFLKVVKEFRETGMIISPPADVP